MAHDHLMKPAPRRCDICLCKVPTEGNYSIPMVIFGRDFYVCGPECAFALGDKLPGRRTGRPPCSGQAGAEAEGQAMNAYDMITFLERAQADGAKAPSLTLTLDDDVVILSARLRLMQGRADVRDWRHAATVQEVGLARVDVLGLALQGFERDRRR